MDSIQCTLDFRREPAGLELCVKELNRCFTKSGVNSTSFLSSLLQLIKD